MRYRILSSDGSEVESGSGDVEVGDGTLHIQPSGGASLRLPFGKVASISEPQSLAIAVTLADGTTIELSQLGRMRTQILAELRDARATDAAEASGAVGKAEAFTAVIRGVEVEVHVFEDAFILVANAAVERFGFSFVTGVAAQDYSVSVGLLGGESLVISRLGRATGAFAELLTARLAEARTRTAAFIGSLLPGLDPLAQRSVSAQLRDGVAVPAHSLDAVHPDASATLLRVATEPQRYPSVAALAQHVDMAIGFKQIESVRRAAVGVTPWRDPAVSPHIGEHEAQGNMPGMMAGPGGYGGGYGAPGYGGGGYGPGGYGGGGYGNPGYGPGGYGGPGYGPGGPGLGGFGFRGGGYGGPFGGGYGGFGGGYGDHWAYGALGGVMYQNPAGPGHTMVNRPDVRRGLLTPETQDLAALSASGTEPTVLAFALFASSRGRVAYTVLNLPEPATYVYEADGDARSVVNRALDDAGFQAEAIHAATTKGLAAAVRQDPPASLLAHSLIAQVPHDANWQRAIAGLLA